jgi:hypothetical protein
MGGSKRMFDPSEAAHDRVRRWLMNAAFVIIVTLVWFVRGNWLALLAAMPASLAVRIFELRFKMAGSEWRQVLRELPRWKWIIYAVLFAPVFVLSPAWALAGIWLYDFVAYYHDRPERMRHLYAITKTLDEARDFRVPWAWALPALAWEVWRRL